MNAPVALRPLPTRITPHAFARLQALRAHTGLSVQEMVRRAIDEYLDRQDPSLPPPSADDITVERVTLPKGKRKLPLPIDMLRAPDAPQKSHQRGKTKVTFR